MRSLISYDGSWAFGHLLVQQLRDRGVQATLDADLVVDRPDLPVTVEAHGRTEDIDDAVAEFRSALPPLRVHVQHMGEA